MIWWVSDLVGEWVGGFIATIILEKQETIEYICTLLKSFKLTKTFVLSIYIKLFQRCKVSFQERLIKFIQLCYFLHAFLQNVKYCIEWNA